MASTKMADDFADDGMDSGQRRLQELGYKQELKRDLSALSSFALSFAIISILTGVTTLFNTGLTYGGTVSMVYGWLIVGIFTSFVGASMSEICSAYPTSGGLYYWAAQLAGEKWAPFASWITGWFNTVGQWAVTASIDFSLASLIAVMLLLGTGGANGGGYVLSKYVVVIIHGVILISHALVNCLRINWVSLLGTFAAFWNIAGVCLLIILIPALAQERQSFKNVFSTFNRPTEETGITSSPYIFLLGLLMSQYTVTGFDASAHLSEETKSSDTNGAVGIMSAIFVSVLVGWVYLLGLCFVVIDPAALLDPANDAGGYAAAQIFYSTFKDRYGSGAGGVVCLGIVAVAIWFCGMGSITSNSRMVYAFSRDGAMPLANVWHVVDKREVPRNAVWLSAAVAFCMALTSLGSLVAFQAMVSIATIGLYISYAIPILFRITLTRKSFRQGPWNLGPFGQLVGWIAVLWVVTITVLFCLPVVYPVNNETLNYAPVAVGGVFFLAVGSWLLSARKWFKGPVVNLVLATHVKDSYP